MQKECIDSVLCQNCRNKARYNRPYEWYIVGNAKFCVDVKTVSNGYDSINNIRMMDERLAYESCELQSFNDAEYDELSMWISTSSTFAGNVELGEEVAKTVQRCKKSSDAAGFERVEVHVDIILSASWLAHLPRSKSKAAATTHEPFVCISVFQCE